MNIKLYRQRKHPQSSGRIIYQGEDSHPYADKDVLIVADGLGGRGGFPHTKINHKIFDREDLYELLFEPIFPREVDDDFKHFVVENFEEIFETREYYFDADDYVRRSGYFASRIVTAITLYELKYNPIFKKETVFARIEGATDGERDAYAMELASKLCSAIAEKLPIVADEGGFEMETRIGGAYLLPTTLTVALMNEREDDVEVLYLWAGDSRGYIWDEVDGTGQVTEDHERDETMTNLITLSRPFTVEGRFITVKKPCVIFNGSDGIYKCPDFANPIDQEYVMLYAFRNFPVLEDALAFLEKTYNQICRDDSSTMAMRVFGYENYGELRAAVERRFGVIGERYLSRLPELLERNYSAELEAMDNSLLRTNAAVRDELIKVDAIAEVVRGDMLMRGYAPLADAKKSVGANVLELEARKNEAEKNIVCWVKRNWVRNHRLKRSTAAARNFIDGESPYNRLHDLSESNKHLCEKIHGDIKELMPSLKDAYVCIGHLLQSVCFAPDEAFKSETYEGYPDAKSFFGKVFDLVDSLKSVEYPDLKDICDNRRAMDECSDQYCEADADAINELVMRILAAEEPEDLSISPACCEELRPLHAAYRKAKKEYDEQAGEVTNLNEKYLIQYWQEKGERLVGLIWNNYRDLIPPYIYDKLTEGDPELAAKRRELVDGVKIRVELYELYNESYFRQYRESRI